MLTNTIKVSFGATVSFGANTYMSRDANLKWMVRNQRGMSKYRAVMTTTDRERITGESDDPDKKVYESVSRVRSRIEELEKDAALLEDHHPELLDELREAVCESENE